MGFKFSYLCDLLSNLEANRTLRASTAARNNNPDFRTVSNWFGVHETRIHHDNTDLLALLSCLFPERRPDRVYWLQHASLARIIARCLLLGVSRRAELDRWQRSGSGDLGQCVENVMRQAENQITADQAVTLEEINGALDRIASRCRFSGSRVRRQHSAVDVDEILGSLYRRVSSREAKWLTRMILKSYRPLILPSDFILRQVHFLLPALLHFQDSLEAATRLLTQTSLKLFPTRPAPDVAQIMREKALEYLSPQIGIKISRPEFFKARSIKHCCKMIGQRRMSLERKYDGEYCQIHIDLSGASQNIRIFSKSGKDSTLDRAAVHPILKKCLRVGDPACKFSRYCILEGEMVVWSDKDEKILEFHKLRKFITRSGVFLGTDSDSQPMPYEHLMIIFYDVLLLDDRSCVKEPHRIRRLLLKEMIEPIRGRAEIAEQMVVDFSRADGRKRLESLFARSITERWEGLVIKACNEPYFTFLSNQDEEICRWIKLKKDYIPGLGDTADFSLVGAAYNPKDAASITNTTNITWTHFYIGCLENKNDASTHTLPRFRVIDTISTHSMSMKNLQLLNSLGRFEAVDVDSNSFFDLNYIHNGLREMQVVFKNPLVVELLGSGFDKPSNTSYFTLRFPRVLKIHFERTFEDTITFSELQLLAESVRSIPAHELSQEMATWSERIQEPRATRGYIVDSSQGQESTTETSPSATRSPVRVRSAAKIWASPDAARISPRRYHTAGCSPPALAVHDSYSQLTRKRASSTTSLEATKECRIRTGPVSIFTEDEQETTAQSDKAETSASFLKEIENVSSQSNAALGSSTSIRDHILVSDSQDENMNIQLSSTQKPVSDGIDVIEETTIFNPLDGDTTGSHIIEIDGASSSRLGTPQFAEKKLRPVRPNKLPIYVDSVSCSPALLNSSSHFTSYNRSADVIFTLNKFIKSLSGAQYIESDSNAESRNVAVGIIIVHSDDNMKVIARTVLKVANRIVDMYTTLPSKGRLFVLEHAVLRDRITNDVQSLIKAPPQLIRKYFYASVGWGYTPSVGTLQPDVVVGWDIPSSEEGSLEK